MTYYTDIEIIEILLKRETRSTNAVVTQLYTQNRKMISQLVFKGGGNEMDVEDLFQELISIFLNNVWDGKFVLQPNVKISTYLFAMAKNRLMKKSQSKKSAYERHYRFWESREREVPDDPYPMQQIIGDQEDAESLAIFNQLDEPDQEILKAFVNEGLSMEEIAERFELTNASTAKTRKYRALEKLRKLMGISIYAREKKAFNNYEINSYEYVENKVKYLIQKEIEQASYLLTNEAIYSYGNEVFGDADNFNKWLNRPNQVLGGYSPLNLLNDSNGREIVRDLIGRIDYGVYS